LEHSNQQTQGTENKIIEMNPYFNPFAVLSNLGPGQMPRYTQIAGMRQQLEGDGLGEAFAWSMSMMTPAEWEAELRRYS
jgi:hypothetical protein